MRSLYVPSFSIPCHFFLLGANSRLPRSVILSLNWGGESSGKPLLELKGSTYTALNGGYTLQGGVTIFYFLVD